MYDLLSYHTSFPSFPYYGNYSGLCGHKYRALLSSKLPVCVFSFTPSFLAFFVPEALFPVTWLRGTCLLYPSQAHTYRADALPQTQPTENTGTLYFLPQHASELCRDSKAKLCYSQGPSAHSQSQWFTPGKGSSCSHLWSNDLVILQLARQATKMRHSRALPQTHSVLLESG